MAVGRIDINHDAVRALLTSDEVLRELTVAAERIAAAAGEGHGVRAGTGRNRARVSVFTETFDAMLGEAQDHTLLRALDAGR